MLVSVSGCFYFKTFASSSPLASPSRPLPVRCTCQISIPGCPSSENPYLSLEGNQTPFLKLLSLLITSVKVRHVVNETRIVFRVLPLGRIESLLGHGVKIAIGGMVSSRCQKLARLLLLLFSCTL